MPTGVADSPLFELGPPQRLQRRLVLARPDRPHITRRALLAVFAGWIPLLVLALAGGHASAFFYDMSVHARMLLAVPLLIIAEKVCAERLTEIAWQFLHADLVEQRELAAFDEMIASTKRLLNSPVAEILIVVLAYIFMGIAVVTVPQEEFALWHKPDEGGGYSLAGWWNVLVSLPLLQIVLFSWLWRWLLWVRFLWLASKLTLRIVPPHPDGAGGIGFLGYSLQAYAMVAFALGVIVAGSAANGVLEGGSPFAHKFLVGGMAALVVAGLTLPLLFFSAGLAAAWRRGVFFYGELASYAGLRFEEKWADREKRGGLDALSEPDSSALADLYQVVSNAYGMRGAPIDIKSMLALVAAMLLPFLPVLLMTVPLDLIFKQMLSLLF